MENPIKMGWFGGTTIFGNIHLYVGARNSTDCIGYFFTPR